MLKAVETMAEKHESEHESGVATLTRPKVKRPSLYKVVMLNDDYSTMEFVITVLQKFFAKTYEEANGLMLMIHHKGKAICGLYPHDIAMTKIMQVSDFARTNQMPLKCVLEKE